MEKIKLNLGCGTRKIHGFINIDARIDVNPDIVADITNINYKDVYLIYACHVLEHIPMNRTMVTLKNWYDNLRIGGILRLSVPDFEAVVDYYKCTKDLKILYTLIYGGQKYDQDFHYIAFDFKTLSDMLIDTGFKDIKKYDWKKTEHHYIDDYSQAYLPHMDKIYGKLMSLNVEAVK